MNITFIGAGYVGLVSGVMMSHFGHNVTCIDTDIAKIGLLKSGILPIYEPDLDQYMATATARGRLHFASDYASIQFADVVFIAVGTPSNNDGSADISAVKAAIHDIYPIIAQDAVIVIKSTVPPGTCRNINSWVSLQEKRVAIASNPEFLREGCAVIDFLKPNRLIIGTEHESARLALQSIYQSLVVKDIPFVYTDTTTAELIKYASNAFLATKIAFINEMANICEKVDASINQLSAGIGLDYRIGSAFLKVGPGFGGSCFPKDILALSYLAKEHNTDALIINSVISANQNRPTHMLNKISTIFNNDLTGKVFAVLGLAFKDGTDDTRCSPAIEIIKLLTSCDAIVKAYDPACSRSRNLLTDIQILPTVEDACTDANALIIATEWQEFSSLNFDIIFNLLKSPIIIDLRNILDADKLKQQGFSYYSIGRSHAY